MGKAGRYGAENKSRDNLSTYFLFMLQFFYDADVMRVPVISKLLDTTDYDRPVGGIEWREGISSGSISYGLEIVDIEGLEQQGLQICYLAPQEIAGQKNFKTRTIYWDCGVWRVCQ